MFQPHEKIIGDLELFHNICMMIEALSKSLKFYDMNDIFQILLEQTVHGLNQTLETMFIC